MHSFCSELCRARGEPLVGTGKLPKRIVLLRWPRGKWRVPRFDAVDMSRELSEAVRFAMDMGLHVALVDRVGDTDAVPRLQAPMEQRAIADGSDAELAIAIRRYANDGTFYGQPEVRKTVMCCTDSRRDACCARFGFATFKALNAQADSDRFQILQCTHVGGCRFAASLVVLPQRERYGRLVPEQVGDFLKAVDAGHPYLPAFRGRADANEVEQIAHFAALKWAKDQNASLAAPKIFGALDAQAQSSGQLLVLRAEAGPEELEITLRAKTFFTQGRCDVVAKGGGQDKLRWVLDSVRPAKSIDEGPST